MRFLNLLGPDIRSQMIDQVRCSMRDRRLNLNLVLIVMYLFVSTIVESTLNLTVNQAECTRELGFIGIRKAHAERSLISIAQNSKWKKIFTKKGITLFSAQRKGSSLPLLKGETILHHNLYEIMAVVEDAKKHPNWVYRMTESTIFERPDPFHLKAYVRFDFPWPSYDRDSVLQVDVKRIWAPHHEAWISFEDITDNRHPQKLGIVRIPRSQGYTRLRWLSPHRTHVVYVIDSDPGGNLPHWLVKWISRDLPYKIITALKQRVTLTRGAYEHFLDRWDPRRKLQSDAPAQFTLPGVDL